MRKWLRRLGCLLRGGHSDRPIQMYRDGKRIRECARCGRVRPVPDTPGLPW